MSDLGVLRQIVPDAKLAKRDDVRPDDSVVSGKFFAALSMQFAVGGYLHRKCTSGRSDVYKIADNLDAGHGPDENSGLFFGSIKPGHSIHSIAVNNATIGRFIIDSLEVCARLKIAQSKQCQLMLVSGVFPPVQSGEYRRAV